mmetsp:Transcript_52868/g.139180  ORF Transcript_52868/g.139180 Transcript_52868/m.139180 type:complete len:91 (+) Transcript_52868:1117-1389(+)
MSSLLLALIPGQSVGLKTSLQAGRVLRILGKIEIFKTIVNALAIALVPVLSVFFILLLFVSIGEPAHVRCPRFDQPFTSPFPPLTILAPL